MSTSDAPSRINHPQRESHPTRPTQQLPGSALRTFGSLEPERAREQFSLGADTRDWSVKAAQADLRRAGLREAFVRQISYRPFDDRFIFYTGQSKGIIGQPARPLADHVGVSGIALGTTRRVETADFKHAFVFSDLPDSHSVSSKETTHVFPLKIHDAFGGTVDNFRPEFKKFLVQKYSGKFTVADTLAYLYAILYCPTYRERFNEFLRDDYARIPFPRKRDSFAELARLGLLLQDLHLLKNVPALDIGRYEGHGPSYIDDVKYEGDSVRINVTRRFAAVPSDIWNFQIGGYSPLSKYLKDRRGRELTISEIDRVRDIARVAASTAAQMIEIDRAYRVAFG